tara:strand:- start:1523 stop:1747 length:225 start_codon:yes stop_codon:yes gene_type:complete
MSKVFNDYYFDALDVIEEIKSEPEEYSRFHALAKLVDVGCPYDLAKQLLDNLESEWDVLADYYAEVQRENTYQD